MNKKVKIFHVPKDVGKCILIEMMARIKFLVVLLLLITASNIEAKLNKENRCEQSASSLSEGISEAISQNPINVSGVVTDDAGDPIPGVNVSIKGTSTGTITDIDGKYNIRVPENEVIVFSFIGMDNIEKTVTSDMAIHNIVMISSAIDLDEVVAVGYGIQKKSHLTGAIAKVEGSELAEAPVANVDEALRGRVAGMQVRNTTGQVGDAQEIVIRGVSSINATNSPLIVIDGVPMPEMDLDAVAADDVESLEVLKDAASTAIYGSRGAAGVIIITTKSGVDAKKTKFSFRMQEGFKEQLYEYDVYDQFQMNDVKLEKKQMEWSSAFYRLGLTPSEQFDASGNPLPNPVGALYPTMDSYLNSSSVERMKTMIAMESGAHNWLEDMSRNNARFRQYSLTAQGGTKSTDYYLSGNYQNNEGVLKDNNYERLYLRLKLNSKLADNVDFGINVTPQFIKQERSTANFQLGLPYDNFMPIYHNDFTSFVTRGVYNPGEYTKSMHFGNGTPVLTWEEYEAWKRGDLAMIPDGAPTAKLSTSSSTNPISKQQERSNTYDEFRVLTSMFLKWKINDKLLFTTTANNYFKTVENNNTETELYNRYAIRQASVYNRNINKFTNENTLNYTNKFGDHNLNVLGGITEEITNYKYARIEGLNIPKGMPLTVNNATLISQDTDETYAYHQKEVLISGLFRVLYDYKGKYLFSASVRADGSSIFAKGNRWGYFPSTSLGWRLSEEPFMKRIDWVSNLKVRASYGLSGNNNIAMYSYLDELVSGNYSDSPGGVISGLTYENISKGNKDITWEKTNQINLGLDIGLFKNRVSLNADYYYTITDDLLLQQTLPLSTGFQNIWQNVGRIENEGVELLLNTVNINKRYFRWKMNFNIAHNLNRVIDFGGQYQMFSYGKRQNEYLMQVGLPVSNLWGWKTDGIFKSQEELDKYPSDDIDMVGSLRRVDINGDGKITEDDKTIIGNPVPKFNWGFGNEFKIRNVDISFLIEGSHDFDITNLDYYNPSMRDNISDHFEDMYVDEYHGSKPIARGGVAWEYTDYIVYDGSYVALRNLSVGYAFGKKVLSRIPFTRLRLYFSGANLIHHIYGDYSGINPEFKDRYYNTVLTGGEQSYTLPLERTYTFGIDLSF